MSNLYQKPGTVLEMEVVLGTDVENAKKEAKAFAELIRGNVKFQHNRDIFMCDKKSCIKIN